MTTQSRNSRSRAEARHEVARAACDLVADGGLDNVSMRRIANRLGSTTGYISHYYADKEELLEAALLAALDEVTGAVSAPPETLAEWFDTVVETLPHDERSHRFWRVLAAFQAASLSSPHLSVVLRNYAAAGEARLAEHLADLAPPKAGPGGFEVLARAVWVLIDGIGTTSAINPGVLSGDQQRVVLRAAVHALIDEFAEGRHTL